MTNLLLALITAVVTVFGPIIVLWLRRRLKLIKDQQDAIYVMVDGNLTEALRKIKLLTQAIADADPENLLKAQAALRADGVVDRKDAAIEALNAYPTPTIKDTPKG